MPLTESLTPDLCLWRTKVLKNCFIQCRENLVARLAGGDVAGVGFSEIHAPATRCGVQSLNTGWFFMFRIKLFNNKRIKIKLT